MIGRPGALQINPFPLPGPEKSHWSAEEHVADIAFDPYNKNRLLSFDINGTVKIWYVSSGLPALTLSAGPTGNVQSSADGRLLATSCRPNPQDTA